MDCKKAAILITVLVASIAPGVLDPNLVLWYPFDETAPNDIAHDSSGHERHGVIDGNTNWDPSDGYFGGSLAFANDTAIAVPNDVLSQINDGITIVVWLKDANAHNGDNWLLDSGDADHRLQVAIVTGDEPHVFWRAGNDTNDVLIWDLNGIDPNALEGWNQWVFAKDETEGTMNIYVGRGPPFWLAAAQGTACGLASKTGVDKTLANICNTPFKIGALTSHDYDFTGKIDELMIFDYSFSPSYFYCPQPQCPWCPTPSDGQTDVPIDAVLQWRPGDYADSHDVYLAVDWDDVNDAGTASTGIYKGRQDPCEYDPPGNLEFGVTYYWRVDMVNDTHVHRCRIWQFTTANYVLIDDFEAYDHATNRIYETWQDGNWNWTGSFIDLATDPCEPVHGDHQAMLCLYDNTVKWDYYHYWSEVNLPFNPARDFTESGVKALTLYFYGDPDNDANDTEQLYVGLVGSYAQVNYPDMNDILKSEWTEWNIPIADFSGVDPCAVTGLLIGFGDRGNTDAVGGDGVVYFDDIRLYPPRCVPERIERMPANFNGDCVIDFGDLKMMAEDWLWPYTCPPGAVPPNPMHLVARWRLDEGSGGAATDSSDYANHGTIEGDYSWVAGRVGPYALEFQQGRVLVPDAAQLRPPDEVSVCAWAWYSATQEHSARVVVKGADDHETYALEINSQDELAFYVRDVNGNRFVVSSDEIYRNEWMHLAGTYNGLSVKAYVDGEQVGSTNEPNIYLSLDTNDLAIGNRSDDYDRCFVGRVDDAHVYDYGLSQAEIIYVGGFDPCPEPPTNIYREWQFGPQIVNFRDYAVLASMWLEQKLWPPEE
jgi:hypothetical protein